MSIRLLFCIVLSVHLNGLHAAIDISFLKSFVSHYECNITGKFTHEYHPYLLDKTAHSLKELEQRLQQDGFHIDGRIIVMGYEEQGVPRYYTDCKDAYFTDEMTHKTAAGWSLKMHNRFGLLTGFLCKGVNDLRQVLERKQIKSLPMMHIDPEQVEIFDGYGTLFQEHAFGSAYQQALTYHEVVERAVLRGSFPSLLEAFIRFWNELYQKELKLSGKQHVAGTQDILFSIAYMRYLQQSQLPLTHFFMGPDITYPIEDLTIQGAQTTRHAQAFVKTFMHHLVPCDNKKTAYVFCSFVDGVGKSTMLGNIQNWMHHGPDVRQYEHVDNSSSQLATVFQFADNVYIADLPAQVSHFTYKPDGEVYVDLGALNISKSEYEALQFYVKKHMEEFCEAYQKDLQMLTNDIVEQGYNFERYERTDKRYSFLAQIILLKKQHANKWIPFSYKGKTYLCKQGDPSCLRMRVSLTSAPSHGLKNIVPEQMVFTLGVCFPLRYEVFLDDLTAQLKQHGIEQVVMVDFASMYSRSSRENIRVNYMVQQLALLFKRFALSKSFYQDFVHNAQLLEVLTHEERFDEFSEMFAYESCIRTLLYTLLTKHTDTSVQGISLDMVTEQLRNAYNLLSTGERCLVADLVSKKLKEEYEELMQSYGTSREFVIVQQLCLADLVAFSQKVARCFSKKVYHPSFSELCEEMASVTYVSATSIRYDYHQRRSLAQLNTGRTVQLLDRVAPNCTDQEVLRPLLRRLRVQWYVFLTNLLYTAPSEDALQPLTLVERFTVPPVFAVYDDAGKICFVQPILDEVLEDQIMPDYSLFDVSPGEMAHEWGMWNDQLYLTNWASALQSSAGVYALGHQQEKDKKGIRRSYLKPRVTRLIEEYQREVGEEHVCTTEALFEMMQRSPVSFEREHDVLQRQAGRNGVYTETTPLPTKRKGKGSTFVSAQSAKIYRANECQRAGARLFVRMIATLEMIMKDMDADIAARRGHAKDFSLFLFLLEHITLPNCYGLFFDEPLFSSYQSVQPVLKWSYFSNH